MDAAVTAARPMRADAQRNYDAILAAARAFAQAGTDAPLEDVARAARVGQGTLYRRFPTREHLFAAILQDRVDELGAPAQHALDAPGAWRAFSEWLEFYDRCATEYPAMSARVGESLSDDTSAVGTLCGPMKTSFARLYQRAPGVPVEEWRCERSGSRGRADPRPWRYGKRPIPSPARARCACVSALLA